jgi:hypothetical protein
MTKSEHLKKLKRDERSAASNRKRDQREEHDRALLQRAARLAAADAHFRFEGRRRVEMQKFADDNRMGACVGIPGVILVEIRLGQTDHVERQVAEGALAVVTQELQNFHTQMIQRAGEIASTGRPPVLAEVVGDVDKLCAVLADRTRAAKSNVRIERQ